MQYSKLKDGQARLSPHFQVKEFSDPTTDVIVLEPALVTNWLEPLFAKVKEYFGVEIAHIIVNTGGGYRSKAYNAKVGGAANSTHMQGKAADIHATDKAGKVVPVKYLACALQLMGCGGIELIRDGVSVHVGPWENFHSKQAVNGSGSFTYAAIGDLFKYFGMSEPSAPSAPAASVPMRAIIKQGMSGADVKVVQAKVGVTVDGIFGAKTKTAVKAYQKARGLTADGIVGAKTRAVMGV